MRRLALSAALFFMSASSLPVMAETAEVSIILKTTSTMMKEKKYDEAQKLILSGLKKEKNSHKLWLALGYVLEADNQFDKALKAFYTARDLKTGIEGLTERITRLENLLKSSNSSSEKDKDKALSLLAQAKYHVEMKNTKKGLVTFTDAVLLDRSLLGSENKLVEQGQKFFQDPANLQSDEEKFYYSGLFSFFAGNYEDAELSLKQYVANFPKSTNIAVANSKLAEIQTLKQQLKEATVISSKPAENRKPAAKIPEKAVVKKTEAAETPAATVQAYQPSEVVDEYAGLDPEQLCSEAMNLVATKPTKAIKLLSRAVRTGETKPEYAMTLGDLFSTRKGFEKEAISTYRGVMEKFPGTKMAEEARAKIAKFNPSKEQRAKEVAEHFSGK